MKVEKNPSVGKRQARMRTRMIEAGLYLFLQFGFRGVSMEAVAGRAEVAKPTLYRYFSDKEALFQAVVTQFFVQAKELCELEFSKSGTVAERISGALTAKYKLFFRLLEGSAFADELYSESARLGARGHDEFERWLEINIFEILVQGGEKKAQIYMQLILACALGISKKAQRVEEIGPAIRLMVQKLLE